MLRAQVGERAFFDALRSYYMKHRHSTAVTDDLRAEMERESKQNLGWFFDQWLRRPGYPEITATWSYDAAAHEVAINVAQNAAIRTLSVARSPSPLIDSSGVSHQTTVALSGKTDAPQQVRVPLAAAPARVVLDPDVEVLARLTVVAPTP